MKFTEEQLDLWEEKYTKFRDGMFTDMLNAPTPELARIISDVMNRYEAANRIFLYFAETGEIKLEAIE